MKDSGFIKEIGRSYLVSSFLPTALFVSIGTLIFRGFAPKIISSRVAENDLLFGNAWVLMVIFTLWVAFGLYSSVNWIVQLFEGYKFPKKVREWMKSRLEKKWKEKTPTYGIIRALVKRKPSKRRIAKLKKYKREAISELQELELQGPIEKNYLLPTLLGNVLRAGEIYAVERYELEGLTIWPRLFHVLPAHFIKDLEEKNNHFIFLLNSSLLAYCIGILGLSVGLIRSPCQFLPSIFDCKLPMERQDFFARGFNSISPSEYIFIGLFFMGFGYFLYRIAVNAAVDYSLFIRAGFDLYRFNLLNQLKQPLPETLEEERDLWQKLSEFFIAGDRLGFQEFSFAYVTSGEAAKRTENGPMKHLPAEGSKGDEPNDDLNNG